MKFVNDLNLRRQARELGVSVWQTPGFLFLMMGVITLAVMTATYSIALNYDAPEVLIISESLVVVVIFTIGSTVIRGVEQMAQLNKAKSEFISVASHQLRTPLSAIRWEAELLQKKCDNTLDEKQKNCISTIELLVKRMSRLVSDLLDVAKIDQGRMVLRKEKIDLNSITREVMKELSPLVRANNTEIVFNETNIPLVKADPEKVKLVIENLLSNAIKYTVGRGKVSIEIRKNESAVVFSVKDNGVGIPEEQHGKLFEKFFRSDNVVKYQTEGTGLGLYIAKNIIEQSRGKIWFKSKLNVGSTFSFSLPIAGTNL